MGTRNLGDAHPTLRARYKGALRVYAKKGLSRRYEIKVSCVLRTAEEQASLYNQNKPWRVLTYCDGYVFRSKHQADKNGFSRAVDFYVVNKKTGRAIWRWHPAMWLFIRICKEVGLECGRYWTMKDSFHVQMYDGDK